MTLCTALAPVCSRTGTDQVVAPVPQKVLNTPYTPICRLVAGAQTVTPSVQT